MLGTVAVEGTEYYRVTATAGARITIDLDDVDANTTLQLFDASGTLVGENFEALRTDEGSSLATDPWLSLIVPADGVYYIAVSGRTGNAGSYATQDLRSGFTYTLNVALEHAPVVASRLLSTASAVMDGGTGDDVLVSSMGDDVILGGSGSDTVSFEQSYTGVTVDLSVTVAQTTKAGRDTIVGVENLVGSREADTLRGDGGANVIDGGGGADTLHGGAGTDTVSFASQTKAATFDLSKQGQRQTVRLGEALLATGFENVTGSALADVLSGDRGANTIDGGAGDDLLTGDAGGASGGGVDVLVGGAGNDTASFAPYGARIVAALDRSGAATVTADGRVVATLREIENLRGGTGNDRLTGNDFANILSGGAGSDTIDGGRGDDVVEGGAGNDVLTGGAGRDTLVYTGGGTLRLDLRRTDAQDTGFGMDRVSGFENVRLNTGNSVVTGDAGDNVFYDAAGNDVIDGGAGIDTMDYSAATGRITATLATTAAQDTRSGGNDVLRNIERLIGGNFGNFLTGSDGANRLVGGTGVDTIIGGRGADVILGGDGNDVLLGDRAEADDLSSDGMDDIIEGGQGVDIIIGGQGNDILRGGSGNDRIVGGSIGFTFYPDGTFQTDTGIVSDGGNDVIDGGEGIDSVRLQFGGRNEDVSIDLSDDARVNLLYSDGIAVGSVTNIEQAILLGGLGNDRFVGTARNDDLRGEEGDDTLIGGLGDDYLFGGTGNDLIDGGEGHDIADFGYGAERGLTLDLRITGAQDTGAWGVDTVRNVEEIFTTIYSDTIVGGDENLTVADDRGGDDRFYGNGGNDNLMVVRYWTNEGASTIVLDGGTGNDRLRFGGGMYPGVAIDNDSLGLRDTATLIGGAGDDYLESVGAISARLDAGDGNDVVAISIAGPRADVAYDITLGDGIDELAIQWAGVDAAELERRNIVVNDFKGGANGDLLGLTGLLRSAIDTNLGEFNPFVAGYAALVKDGRDTLLQIDRDGRGGDAPLVTVMRLKGTDAFSLTASNVYAYILDPEGLRSKPVAYEPIITQFIVPVQTTLVGHAGRDDLRGSSRADSLFGMAGDDIINGADGNDLLSGGAGADYLIAGAGNDRIDGGLGGDTMLGGTGDDIYVVDSVDDAVSELAGEGTDTVYAAIDHTLAGDVENLYLTGGARFGTGNALANGLFGTGGGDYLSGMDGDDLLKGWGGDDQLFGDGGRDTLYGAEGNDWLDGGAGADTLQGDGGDDSYVVDDAGDKVTEYFMNGQGGVDTVFASVDWTLGLNIENLFLIDGATNGTGNALDNVLLGTSGANVLRGGAGNDTLIGGDGADTLFGGSGADRFVFADGFGKDTIRDFGSGDVIDLGGYTLDRAPTVTDVGADVLIDLGSGNTILLSGIQPDQLVFTGNAFGFAG